MAQSKTPTAVDKTRKNAWGMGGRVGNNSQWSANIKETSDCLNLLLAFFLAHFVSNRQDNEQ